MGFNSGFKGLIRCLLSPALVRPRTLRLIAFSDSIPPLETRPAGVMGINMQFTTLEINAQEVVMAFFLDVAS